MMRLTHLMFAILLALFSVTGIFAEAGLFQKAAYSLIILFGALLPDIDYARSTVGKKVKILSFIIQHTAGHRGILHSVVPLLVIASLMFTVHYQLFLALFIGYGSHLILDMLTPMGVRIFFPLGYKVRGFVKTNSLAEKSVLVIVSLVVIMKGIMFL